MSCLHQQTYQNKAPNILVISNNEEKFKDFRDFLRNLIGINAYTIYNVNYDQLDKLPSIWMDNCQLLVNFFDNNKTENHFTKEFFINGGKVLSLPDVESYEITQLNGYKCLISSFKYDIYQEECEKEAYLNDYISLFMRNNGIYCISRLIPIYSDSQPFLNETYFNLFTQKFGLKVNKDTDKSLQIRPYQIYSKNRLLNSTNVIENYLKDHLSNGVQLTTECQVSSFNKDDYFKNLETSQIGKIVLYSEVVTTTMNVITNLPNSIDLVAIAQRQIDGQGSSKNEWLSPLGCSMFTIYLNLHAESFPSGRLCLLQYLTTIACVEAILFTPGYEKVPIKIKWPNDIFYENHSKLGGVIVKTSLMSNVYQVRIGVGVNTANNHPTICLNSIFRQLDLEEWSCEKFIAKTLNRFEYHLNELKTSTGLNKLIENYERYWLHSGQKIIVEKWNEQVEIIGIDEYGFLKAKRLNNEIHLLQPDGNRFDMLRNLIVFK